jgi:uncharacterized integral membrane protein
VNQISALISGLASISGLAGKREITAVSPAVLLGTFATALFLSALMLFSVQPLFAKMALPKLGGAPAVWAVSMCFFQTALLAGYCYAHLLNRYLSPSRAVLFHIGLLALTCFALPIGLPASLSEPPAGDAYFWLLSVLALGVGMPFFAVSANAPLLQAWFARTGHADAKDPYFLYGASNLGSLGALLAYPLLIEPTMGLNTQSWVWAGGFGMLAVVIASCGLLMLERSTRAEVVAQAAAPKSHALAMVISWQTRLTWVALAAIPSALMVAVTTHITTDVGSAPFIWVIPLALFLLTFILVFKDKLAFNYGWLQVALPAVLVVMLFVKGSVSGVLLALAASFMASLVCHRELYQRRPAASHLTEFYIWMSVGGVIGGIAAALVAPQLFTTVIEFKLALLLSLLCFPGVLLGANAAVRPERVLAFGAAAAAFLYLNNTLVDAGHIANTGVLFWVLVEVALLCMFLTRKVPEHRAIIAMVLVACGTMKPGWTGALHQERSFFGTNTVKLSSDGRHRTMEHGTTLHGAERIVTDAGVAITRPVPATYYYPGSPMQRGIELARQTYVSGSAPFAVGVVGLGTGSLACYAQANETWRYFEIDPMVARIARDPKLFGFLSTCLPNNEILIGDARLTLKSQPDAGFNYLVIDAFSSDAIPAHLLTREAFTSYLDKLTPGGVIAIHISNRYLDLAPSIAATVATLPGLNIAEAFSNPTLDAPDALRSQVLFVSKDQALMAEVAAWPDGKALTAGNATPWTDDYSDVLSALIRKIKE